MFDQSRTCGDLLRDSTLCLVESWYSRHVMPETPRGPRRGRTGARFRLIETRTRWCGTSRSLIHQEYACPIVTSSAQDTVIGAFSSSEPLEPRRSCISGGWHKPVNVRVERSHIAHICRQR